MKQNSPTGPVVSADVPSETAFVADELNNDTVKAAPELRGVTGRVVIFSLVLAMLFGYSFPSLITSSATLF